MLKVDISDLDVNGWNFIERDWMAKFGERCIALFLKEIRPTLHCDGEKLILDLDSDACGATIDISSHIEEEIRCLHRLGDSELQEALITELARLHAKANKRLAKKS